MLTACTYLTLRSRDELGQHGGTLVEATAPDPFETILSAPVRIVNAVIPQDTASVPQQATPMSDLRVAIVGGGLAGLAVALSCQQAGIKNVTVYERDVCFDDRRQGYGLTLTNNPKGPLAKLGVLDEAKHVTVPPVRIGSLHPVSKGATSVEHLTARR